MPNAIKIKRKVDHELIKYIGQSLPCIACAKPPPSECHHIKTRKSGGDDSVHNCISLCRRHHAQIHACGLVRFSEEFESIKYWLISANWIYDGFKKKWIYEGEA